MIANASYLSPKSPDYREIEDEDIEPIIEIEVEIKKKLELCKR